jgi:hypothetical protein
MITPVFRDIYPTPATLPDFPSAVECGRGPQKFRIVARNQPEPE